MAAFNKIQQFVGDLCAAVHNFSTHTLKVALSNTAVLATNATLAAITQIGAGNGYTTGGTAVTLTTNSQTGGTYTLAGNQVVFTAAGGSIGPFRYAVIYNDTPTSPADPNIGWWDYGSSITLADGETFTVKFSNTNPGNIFTLT